jgi:hypothetical protein
VVVIAGDAYEAEREDRLLVVWVWDGVVELRRL